MKNATIVDVVRAALRVPDLSGAFAHPQQPLVPGTILPPQPRAIPPRSAAFLYDLGLTCAAMGDNAAAIDALRRATHTKPGYSAAWRKLADLLSQAGDQAGADLATAHAGPTRAGDIEPARFPGHLSAAQIEKAEGAIRVLIRGLRPADAANILRAHLMESPRDFAALRMLAQFGLRGGQFDAMEKLLERAMELAPGYLIARQNYTFVLLARNKAVQAIPHIDRLLAEDPRNENNRVSRAKALGLIGDYDGAIESLEAIRHDTAAPGPGFWLSYGHILKYVGRPADSLFAYRKCLDLAPAMGDAYWGIANLKTALFSAADRQAMRGHLAGHGTSLQTRITLHYALGRALEQAENYAESFAQYAKGAALKHAEFGDSADDRTRHMRANATFFSASRFVAAAGSGCADPSPIFIVGLPRAGSTLVEQILASHSAIEGTQELPVIAKMIWELASRGKPYPECLATLDAAEITSLGASFLHRSRIYRRTGKPFFIDKMPSNWADIGFIHLILPNAKIIDVRRNAMANCFSVFKQLFGNGHDYAYDLTVLGRYYTDYLELMAHFDTVLPGRIHRVSYENLVGDTHSEIRRLLAYCGLPFELACTHFWENRRPIGTPSAEQVRQPIFREGLDQWRHYEPWLGPLKQALGMAS